MSKPITVVRVLTSAWYDGKALHRKRTVRLLRRLSHGHCAIEEDAVCAGADEVWPLIENVDTVEDGIYEVIFVPGGTDWESGHLTDWSYRLAPFDQSAE